MVSQLAQIVFSCCVVVKPELVGIEIEDFLDVLIINLNRIHLIVSIEVDPELLLPYLIHSHLAISIFDHGLNL